MPQYQLAHITDLADLSDEDVLKFAAELPTLVAALRIVKSAAADMGVAASERVPHITYAPEIGDQLVVRRADGRLESFSGQSVRAAEPSHTEASAAIRRARRP